MIRGGTSIKGGIVSITMTTDGELMEVITIKIIGLEEVEARRITAYKGHTSLLITLIMNNQEQAKNSKRLNRYARIIVMTVTI